MFTGLATGRVRFAQFEFDRVSGELYCDGDRVRLQAQPSQILTALLEHPGDVVTRERLRERLWMSDTFVDYDQGLNMAMKKLRHALGDSAEAPAFIETLASRGYRFIGQAEPLEDARVEALASMPRLAAAALVPESAWRPPRALLWAAAAGLLCVWALLVWRAESAPGTPVPSDSPGPATAPGAPTTRIAAPGDS